MTFSVLVLSGGQARRLGQDKASTVINGSTMLDRVLRDIPEEASIVIVGDAPKNLKRKVIITREEPAGAGPLAALAAGLIHVVTSNFLLLATDMPFVGDLGTRLLEILEDSPIQIDAVVPIDESGKTQPLCAAYRTATVRGALARIGNYTNGSMKQLTAELQIRNYDQQNLWELSDVDTVENLEKARSHARKIEGDAMMNEWIAEVKTALGLKVEVDVDLVLDLARDAAHNVTRPAAPVTAYLLGMAVAGGQDPKLAAAKIQHLALSRGQSKED